MIGNYANGESSALARLSILCFSLVNDLSHFTVLGCLLPIATLKPLAARS